METSTALDGLKGQIIAAADTHGIPRDVLAAQVWVESGGAVNAVGDGGHSRGLMQIDDLYHDYDHARMLTDAAYALDYGGTLMAGYHAQYGAWDTALVAYNGDWANTTHYLARVAAARGQFAAWLNAATATATGSEGGISLETTGEAGEAGITGAVIVAEAMRRRGDVRETDAENGDHAVSGYCWAFVQDVLRACGLTVAHYGSARAAGDAVAGQLQRGAAEAGSIGFWRGAGWSADDHVGICLGDGQVISALATVTISAGWEADAGFRGWVRWAGVVGAGATVPVQYYVPGNPFGRVPLMGPFWTRWDTLAGQDLALPLLGWPVAAERTLADGRRVQRFERGRLVTQPGAAAPWDVVQPLLADGVAAGA